MHLWKSFEDLQPYLKGLTLSTKQKENFKILGHKWAELYIQALSVRFGDEHITNCMVQSYHKPLNAQDHEIWIIIFILEITQLTLKSRDLAMSSLQDTWHLKKWRSLS